MLNSPEILIRIQWDLIDLDGIQIHPEHCHLPEWEESQKICSIPMKEYYVSNWGCKGFKFKCSKEKYWEICHCIEQWHI